MAEDVWKVIIEILASVCSEFPEVLRIDRDPSVMVTSFWDAVEACVVIREASAVERHNAIGVAMRYHAPLRWMHNTVWVDEPTQISRFALRLAVKASNYTMDPIGPDESLRVF